MLISTHFHLLTKPLKVYLTQTLEFCFIGRASFCLNGGMVVVTFFFTLVLSLSAFSMECESKGPNVILFTWDGVRSHEFFKGTGLLHTAQLPASERGQIFKKNWSKYAEQGMVLGEGRGYKIASDIGVSLPSYQAIMAGHTT